ncbi:MAG: hypothetical protein ACUVYA_04305 [Planctomycetota bacterium]
MKLGAALGCQALAERHSLPIALSYLEQPQVKLAAPRRRSSAYSEARLVVSGAEVGALETAFDLENEAFAWFESVRGRAVSAALARAVFRAVAALGAQAALERGLRRGDADSKFAAMASELAGFAVREALYAADTPDTRSWSLLPREVLVRRVSLEPGKQRVSIAVRGERWRKVLEPRPLLVRPGGFPLAVWVSSE